MKLTKGVKFKEWLSIPMDKVNTTTARVFLLLGYFLGLLAGLSFLIIF